MDPVDEAILQIAKQQPKITLSQLTSDELFFLSIARDAAKLSEISKVNLRRNVLNEYIKVMKEDLEIN